MKKAFMKFVLKFFKKKKRITTKAYFQTGAQKDPSDKRDFKLAVTLPELPKRVMLKPYCEVKYQGYANSCTAFAVTSAWEISNKIAGKKIDLDFPSGSELYNYYNSRVLEDTFPSNVGVFMRDALKIANQKGICPEKLMTYNDGALSLKPGIFCDSFANLFKIKSYMRIYGIQGIKNALAQNKPVAIGTPIYKDWIVADQGKIKLPSGTSIGGHAYVIVGYDDDLQSFYILNSWNTSWAIGGFAWLPYEYINKVSWYDAWVLEI